MTEAPYLPHEIEEESLRRIEEAVGAHDFPPDVWFVLRRMIHATGDLDFLHNVRLHPSAIEVGVTALRGGRPVVTDTRMLLAGISTERLRGLGVDAHCFIDDPVVAQTALRHGITRSAAAMDRALPLLEQGIVVIGNAPTALLRVLEFMEKGAVHPALVIGLPVGFVSAPEAKEALIRMDFPYITTLGPKGGSAVAASTVNALAIMALEEEGPCQGG